MCCELDLFLQHRPRNLLYALLNTKCDAKDGGWGNERRSKFAAREEGH